MEILVLKQYQRLRLSDLLSAIFGFFGILCGSLSIAALQVPWDSSRDSSILTISSLIADTLSTFIAVQAFFLSRIIREIKIVNNIIIRKREKVGGRLDFGSFVSGIFGMCAGWVSLTALFEFWNSTSASIIATSFSVALDVISFLLVFGAVALIESINNKYFKNEPTKGVSRRVSRREKRNKNKAHPVVTN